MLAMAQYARNLHFISLKVIEEENNTAIALAKSVSLNLQLYLCGIILDKTSISFGADNLNGV